MADSNATKSWMECFGCETMDPWRHRADDIHLRFPPYVPSAALGMYAPMLESWSHHFPLDQMRVVNYQDLADDPLEVLNHFLRYLGLEEYTAKHMEILHPGRIGFKGSGAKPLPKETLRLLGEFYRPLNEQLDKMLVNHPIPWRPFGSARNSLHSSR